MERLRLWASLTKPRHRFAIMDVVEMKARNWTPTSPAKSSNLHRLEEIRAKFESEQELFAKNQTYLDSLSDMDSLESSESSLPSFKDMFSFDYAKHVFDEYAVRNDAAHAFKDIEGLKSIDIKEFVRDLISISFYKDARSRQSIGELFYKCLKGSLLNHEHFGNGLKLFFHSLCEREEDAENDLQTNVSTQIGQFLSKLFQIDYIM